MSTCRLRFLFCIAVLAALAWAVSSCGSRADRPSLVAADSLILHDPDSACAVLEAYPADSLTADGDRAYHALLTTIARYKAYRPATADSLINIAVGHYDRSGADPDRRMRSLLYKGCVMEELGDPQAAMHYYKQAQYACPDNDHFHRGYIHYKIGCLLQSHGEAKQSAVYYKQAMTELQRVKEPYYSLNCIISIGEVSRISEPDTAKKYFYKGIGLAKKNNDSFHVYEGYSGLAGLYFYHGNFDRALKYSKLAINSRDITLGNNDVYYYACESYLAKGLLDSAQAVFKLMPPPVSAVDSMSYYRCKSDIFEKTGSIDSSYFYSEESDKQQSKVLVNRDNSLAQISMSYDHRDAVNRNNVIFACVVAVFVVLIIVFFLRFRAQRKHSVRLMRDLEALNERLGNTLTRMTAIKDTQAKSAQDIQVLKTTISQYIKVLKKCVSWGVSSNVVKNKKIKDTMDSEFYDVLYRFIDIEYPGLIESSRTEFGLKENEIRILCLELCGFPNFIIWSSTDLSNLHSLLNKKKIIASKVNNAASINDIASSWHK